MSQIPAILIPYLPTDPMLNSPAWFRERPRLYHLKSGLAITLDTLIWRDRFGKYWTIPAGFITDGASVPWALRCAWSKWDDKTIRPALVHDLRYCLHDYFKNWPCYDNQKAADLSLLDGMRLEFPRPDSEAWWWRKAVWAVTPDRPQMYYLAVRLFGRSVYEYKNEEKIMLEWIEVLRKNDDAALNKWIEGVIEQDKAA